MPRTDAGESWERLRSWLRRRVDQMADGNYARLPSSFANDDGQVASEALHNGANRYGSYRGPSNDARAHAWSS